MFWIGLVVGIIIGIVTAVIVLGLAMNSTFARAFGW